MMPRRLLPILLASLAACSPAQPEPGVEAPAPIPEATQGFAEGIRIAWDGGQPVTPEEATQMIGLNGPEGAILALGAGTPRSKWTTVLAGIASAEPEWLGVAAALEPGASGERAEELDIALKAALATDAAATLGVLEVARQRLSPTVVCAGEDSVTRRLKPAVEAVRDASVAAKRQACLDAMR